jgi:hypothetical protein
MENDKIIPDATNGDKNTSFNVLEKEEFVKDMEWKKNKITSLEILLSIIEVAQHGQHYNIENSNRSVPFWRKVSELKICDNIFNSYRPETIRKYWRLINDRQVGKVIAIIRRIQTFKEDYNVKHVLI